MQPTLVLCGHSHDCFGAADVSGKSRILNPGPNGMALELPVKDSLDRPSPSRTL